MHLLVHALREGLSRAANPAPALPLYLTGLLLGLLQAWPALAAGSDAATIYELSRGGGDSLAMYAISGGPAAAGTAALWVAGALAAATLYGAAYNFFSGGILARWAGGGRFWASCRHSFWSFTGLGALLLLFAGFAVVLAAIVGSALGVLPGLVTAAVLLQLANLLGEYARAVVVVDGRRDPARAMREAIALCARRPGALLLGLLGFGLHAGLAWLAWRGTSVVWVDLALAQLFALLWVWLKLLRLAWALAYARADRGLDTGV